MAGTDRTNPLMAGGPVIILVEPQLGENIGMVARAMANFGLAELRLVSPRDGWPNDKARAAASRADHVIDGAVLHAGLASAIGDLNLVLATTARARDGFKPVSGPAEACAKLRVAEQSGQRTGILFGRERFGLSNEEISLADEIVTFPVNRAFASLNIAQAVLLMAYEWMKSAPLGENETLPFSGPKEVPANKQQLFSFFDRLECALEGQGYFRPPEKRQRMVENLRSVITGAGFGEPELRVLHGVIRAFERSDRVPAEEGGAGDLP